MRLLAAALAAASLALLAGCGGDDSAAVGAESAATVAPASTQLFASIDADTGSDQWERLQDLLERFPGRDRLVEQLGSALEAEGVTTGELERAFGPTVDLVVLDLQGDDAKAVGLTKTDDRAALEALLAKSDEEFVVEELEDGWTAFSDEAATIDALRTGAAQGTLADDGRFSDAMSELPDEALAKVYLDGEGLQQQLQGLGGFPQPGGRLTAMSAALVAEDDGARMQVWTKTDGSADVPDVGELLEDVPDDVIAFVDIGLGPVGEQLRDGLEGVPGATQALDAFEAQLGVTLEDVGALFEDEVVLYVRPGLLIPEVTLVARTDEEQGRETVDALLSAAAGLAGGQTRSTQVGDLDATEAALGPVTLYATGYDGRVVVSTSKQGIEDLRGDGDRLADDDRYRGALEAAGVGDDEDVFLYVDVDEAYALAERLAQLAGEPLPADARENVEPLRAVVVSGELGEDESRGSVFLALD